ncbi:type VI secretion protein [Desulfuromonas versatilis]|uniref:Type VI secretion protein n=1 Tax=Desulfuromonas versatilis TaxID=2802975 RepID=A0ABM9SDK7_9BACT|nr:type VI secretion system baseplate subunit TssK [Desulfuromonas versatilis]BCR03013.1 type VI secretion protein [Desulfuromonas versatilis]
MGELNKVIWAEGMFLGQQHFQAWDRYQERSQLVRSRVQSPFSWGLLSLGIDDKAMANGNFRLQECSAIFPDGRLVSFDASRDEPLACELRCGGGETAEVFLALPANARVKGVSGYPDRSQLCGWQADYRQLGDEYDNDREREVLLARPNLALLTDRDCLEQFVCIKIARVVNEGDGGYRLVREFIPPVARLGASVYLKGLLGRVIEGIGARLRTLNDRRGQFGGGPGEFARTDPAQILLLHSLNSAYPQLLHFQQHPDLGPEPLYRLFCQLVGGLCAFSPELEVSALPRYQHGELTGVFQSFERLLGNLINFSTTAPSAALRLTRESEALLSVTGLDSQILQGASLFLEVLFEAEDPLWITDFTRQIKVASRGTIELTVASALPGVRIVHTQRPPNKLSVKSGCEYFRIEPRGDFWGKVLEEGSLALFLPRHFSAADIELVTVQE